MTNIDQQKSYSSERNLYIALVKHGLNAADPIIVRNREGRWTAIFTVARLNRGGFPLIAPCHRGFLIVN